MQFKTRGPRQSPARRTVEREIRPPNSLQSVQTDASPLRNSGPAYGFYSQSSLSSSSSSSSHMSWVFLYSLLCSYSSLQSHLASYLGNPGCTRLLTASSMVALPPLFVGVCYHCFRCGSYVLVHIDGSSSYGLFWVWLRYVYFCSHGPSVAFCCIVVLVQYVLVGWMDGWLPP